MSKYSVFGATLLVTGCCIGAGMIGLPVMSALTGFMPSVVAMFFCYVFTTLTGLLLVEATLWFDEQVNLPSIVEFTLGKAGKALTIFLFLSLFYCLFVAYLDAGGVLFAELLSTALRISVPHSVGLLACLSFVFGVTYAGTKIVDGCNRYMLVGMVLSYLILVVAGLPHVSKENLLSSDWSLIYGVVPILLICFGYQNLVPSLVYYLQKDVKAIRIAIVLGNAIPFFVYLVWEYVILGMLPAGSISTGNEVEMVAQLLQKAAISSLSIMFLIKSFSFFAMLTSFIPNAVSFVDFLKDGFRQLHKGENKNELIFYGLVFMPPTVCTLIYPHLFLHALGFAGGFIDVLLFGVLPAAVVLVGRRMRQAAGPYQVIGGYVTPAVILLLSLILLGIKVVGNLI